jgi:hypothetical protein
MPASPAAFGQIRTNQGPFRLVGVPPARTITPTNSAVRSRANRL